MRKVISGILVFCLCFLIFVPTSKSQDSQLTDIEKQIEDLKKKLETTQTQERTLSAEINTMSNQIKLTTLEISETKAKIVKLSQEIGDLGLKIDRLDTTLSKLSQLLIEQVIISYKVHRVPKISLLLSSHGITDAIKRMKYMQIVEEHNRQALVDVQLAKVDFSEKKELRESKKQQLEELNKQLEAQKLKLDQQRKAKEALLIQTKNDEVTYQSLLQQALSEKQAIEAALVNGEKVGPVKVGDSIAVVGNTGYPACSTGAHLHFEVRQNNQWVNPGNYLKSKTVADQQNSGQTTIGSGDWEWPLSGDISITQHYGLTPYSWRYAYSGGIHTGIDMISETSSVIRAPKDGVLYSASQDCGNSSIIKIKYIDHGNGLVSFYLHVQ